MLLKTVNNAIKSILPHKHNSNATISMLQQHVSEQKQHNLILQLFSQPLFKQNYKLYNQMLVITTLTTTTTTPHADLFAKYCATLNEQTYQSIKRVQSEYSDDNQ